jgi:hypothetical protein
VFVCVAQWQWWWCGGGGVGFPCCLCVLHAKVATTDLGLSIFLNFKFVKYFIIISNFNFKICEVSFNFKILTLEQPPEPAHRAPSNSKAKDKRQSRKPTTMTMTNETMRRTILLMLKTSR